MIIKNLLCLFLIIIIIISILLFYKYLKNCESYSNNSNIVKKIWIYWDKGWEKAPIICKECLESWKKHNKNWDINELDDKNISKYITPLNIQNIQKKSDNYRLQLLKKYGGIWVDATVMCMKPLDNWLPSNNSFFAFSFIPSYKDKLISNWFLYSEKDGYVVSKLLDNFNYNDKDYFSFHHLFTKLVDNDKMFMNIWNNMKKISVWDVDLTHRGIFTKLTPYVEKLSETSPLFKLKWKNRYQHNPNTIYKYILNKSLNN